ncbi:hypothetical protein CHS0354_003455 [Potamilus streckersoni]|uniref:Uncharacterized protein n=1 Tax=Potamilus streckersoni TaxID=2493646 RepID=A0AAE0SNQ7_9BIVA|nr:hypothetical protein CHS0354_003455 [Potamilus streckersoni]
MAGTILAIGPVSLFATSIVIVVLQRLSPVPMDLIRRKYISNAFTDISLTVATFQSVQVSFVASVSILGYDINGGSNYIRLIDLFQPMRYLHGSSFKSIVNSEQTILVLSDHREQILNLNPQAINITPDKPEGSVQDLALDQISPSERDHRSLKSNYTYTTLILNAAVNHLPFMKKFQDFFCS